jgi:predicted XRE-type DNA-binding protein
MTTRPSRDSKLEAIRPLRHPRTEGYVSSATRVMAHGLVVVVALHGLGRCEARTPKTATMTKRAKMARGGSNVFRDLGFREPNLALRSEVMIRIEEARAAIRLGLTQPRLNALPQGRIDQFSLDALVNAATRAGRQVDLLVVARKRTAERAIANA